jgi:hypothetical protein
LVLSLLKNKGARVKSIKAYFDLAGAAVNHSFKEALVKGKTISLPGVTQVKNLLTGNHADCKPIKYAE